MIMDSGVFEPVNRTSTRFDDTSLKYYKLKPETTAQNDISAPTPSDDKENLNSIPRYAYMTCLL